MVEEVERLLYKNDLFVNREQEIEAIRDKARRISQGTEERRVVFFYGERGSSKTWLLRELERLLRDELSFATYFIDLEDRQSRDVNRLLADQPQERPLAVLVDAVEMVDDGFRNELLEWLLAPLAQDSRVLIVLAERGKPSYWSAPQFREKAETYDLPPFSEPYVEAQIGKQASNTSAAVDEVFELSGGYPWLIYLLAVRWPDRLGVLERAADLFLEGVDADLRRCLELLSVLRAFDESRMGALVPIHCPELAEEVQEYPGQARLRRRLVKETTLVRWNEELGGWVLDKPVRRTLEASLRERDKGMWRKLHCAAHRLYQRWAGEHPEDERWAEEADYHAKCLKNAGYNPDNCPEGSMGQEG